MRNGTGTKNNKAQDKHKDSCKYSIEISKQFLTLSSAGIAFVVGLAMARSITVSNSFYWSVGLFAVSVAVGLFYVMSVVAHINQDDNYNVYTTTPRCLALIQIVTFLAAISVLGFIILSEDRNSKQMPATSDLELSVGSKSIKHRIPTNTVIKIHITDKDEVDFQISPAPYSDE